MANRIVDLLGGPSATSNVAFAEDTEVHYSELIDGPFSAPFDAGDRLTGTVQLAADGFPEGDGELYFLIVVSRPYPDHPETIYSRLLMAGSEPPLESFEFDIEAPITELSVSIYLAPLDEIDHSTSGGRYTFPENWAEPSFTAEVTITAAGGGEPDPEPGTCFWTDLVNVTQACESEPEPEPSGFADFWMPRSLGHGSSDGRIAVMFIDGFERAPYVSSTPLFDALLEAESVRITGVAGLFEPPAGEAPAGADEGEVVIEAGITWTDVDRAMTLQEGGGTSEYYWHNDEPEATNTWTYVRIDVDGQTFYGVVYIGDGV
jgi:hypothetical protein